MRSLIVMLFFVSVVSAQSGLIIVGGSKSDFESICKLNDLVYTKCETLSEAVYKAKQFQGVMVLNNAVDKEELMSDKLIKTVKRKKIRIFFELQKRIPGLKFKNQPFVIDKERAVVTTDKIKGLSEMDVLTVNNKEMLLMEDDALIKPLLVMAKVAGYDNAEYGLKVQIPVILTTLIQFKVTT